jgi:hypothetical protein
MTQATQRPAKVRVTCITIGDGGRGHEHITRIGGGGQWGPITVAIAIAVIESRLIDFEVVDPRTGLTSTVQIVYPGAGVPYLRTRADGVWNDNLLSLPSC